ncbi:MAG: hypothetical protein AB7P76_02960 [Candidatus Melainabacteria bacterium]
MSTVIFELEKQYQRNMALRSLEQGERPVNIQFLSGGSIPAWEGKTATRDVREGSFFPPGALNLSI